MKTEKYRKVKDLGNLHDICVNGYAVKLSLLKDGNYLMQAEKYGKLIYNHKSIVSREFLEERFQYPSSDYSYCNVIKALEYLDPEFFEEDFDEEVESYS